MKDRIVHIVFLFGVLFLITGCTTVKAPFDEKGDYPSDWPKIKTPGAECMELEGTYYNEGVVVDPSKKDLRESIQLTRVLREEWYKEKANTFTLKVETTKVGTKGDSTACLQIILDEDETRFRQFYNCSCLNDRLAFTFSSNAGAIPPAVIGISSEALWLTKAEDGSLIVKIWDQIYGLIAVIPFKLEDYAWARFKPVNE